MTKKWKLGASQSDKYIIVETDDPIEETVAAIAINNYAAKSTDQHRREALEKAKLITATPLLLDVLKKQEHTLSLAILATPTGELRDMLTGLNIERMDIIQKATT